MFRCGFSGGGAVQSLRSFCLKTGGPFCVKKRKIHRPGGSRLSEDSSGNLSDSCLAERKKSVRDPPVSEIPSALPEICHGVIKWPMAMRQHDAIRPQDRVDGRCSGKKRMDRRIKFICPFDLAEHQGVEPWHRSPGLSHFEFLNRLDEAGFVRLSLAVAGIFCASQKWHIIAIYRRKSTTFCEVPLEKPPFTRSVRSCISGAVPLDVR